MATTRRLVRALARRFAWHMLGAAIGLALVLLVHGLLSTATGGVPEWVVAAVAVAAAVALGLVPGARELEVTAARALLDVDAELVAPDEPRLAHRARTAAWVVLHLVTGLVVAFGLFGLVPAAVLIGLEAVAGRSLGSGLPLPSGAGEVVARLALCVAGGLLAAGATWPLGVAARTLARRVLGPTAHDRMETALARARREAEHTRLARELHDGIGHALTVVSVQAAAGRRVVAADPDAAAGALAAIEDTARTALAELDQLLAVLRDDAADDAPMRLGPALGDVVEAHRRAGLDVRDRVDLPPGLPALLGRTVRRIVTEALTNAHRHGGPGPVTLEVDRHGDQVRVEVANPLAARGGGRPSGGRGLAGVRERVALFGGTVTAGPDGDRWVLRATLPAPAPVRPAPVRKDPDA
ncbi:sensor histidine kinase [Promicromonospora thailandica]|uniref:histidine kinase n=1 Tax=Promicromonospora thailandica TaxID=765201 RepID=A0A9X2GAB2_9MICO|nr:histidine kinase [Promicromonospora thailandica]MCP2264816.1 Histidine kinase [Promicromonospora thailandica]BFF18932.1 histidine kinase [Promicromonospora thailandica]